MSFKNETRLKLGYSFLTLGAVLLFFSYLSDPVMAGIALILGIALLGSGAMLALPVTLINSLSYFVRTISRSAEPRWKGEILHTDGSEYKIRYDFDDKGRPWFVASDICIAAGTKVPDKDVRVCGGVTLAKLQGDVCFSEENVQTFLIPLATNNHAANRLLILIRNNVLRKLEKQREADKQHR
jgi:hypothetical protein